VSTLTSNQEVLQTGPWEADPAHSRIEFAVDYLTGTFRGTFSPFAATLEVDGDGSAVLHGTTSAGSIHVQDENLSAHLQSPDFFDAERTPELAFESTRFVREGERVEVDGTLTIKGVSQPVHLTGTIGEPLEDPYGRARFGLRLEGTIDRTAFGLDWNAPLPSGEPALANDVALTAELYLVRK
jgi:polyisoprenoid-binding protein YceI